MSEERAPNRIRELRDAQHLTVRELAEKSGIDFNTISRMERGAQPLDLPRMQKIAKALGVRSSELLNDEDVELRASDEGRAVLAEFDGFPTEDIPGLVAAAREVARMVRSLAARSSAGALMGAPHAVSQLADAWNSWNDAERDRALELLRVAARREH